MQPPPDSMPVVLRRKLCVQHPGGLTLLGAIARSGGASRAVRLVFRAGPSPDDITPLGGLTFTRRIGIGEAPVIYGEIAGTDGPLSLGISGLPCEITASEPETELFAGLDVLCAVRNGESAEVTRDWIVYHVRHHGMSGALILDRARPGQAESHARELTALVGDIPGLKRLVLLQAPVPLGQAGLPAEAHPLNAPFAPGKDRMKIPAADPWHAPLADVQIYELLRAQFLEEARAVANIDVCDLLVPATGRSVFDRAGTSATGCIRLSGIQVYPWRTRKAQPAGFGDHICVPFDSTIVRRRWCLAPAKAAASQVWRLTRVVGTDPGPDDTAQFHRHMSLRHPTGSVSRIVPKSSLVEDPFLLNQATEVFAHTPVRMPEQSLNATASAQPRTAIVTAMKNEGAFILEWLAYHRAIGVNDFLVYTNDCTDSTDTLLSLLQDKGLVQHRDNPFREKGLKPQHGALLAAEREPLVRQADWLIAMDVDEFINIHCGEGRLDDLFRATHGANMIAMTWRLFGNSDVHGYEDRPIVQSLTRCAAQLTRKPHQAWGFKTLYRNLGIFRKLGVHRPKGLKPQLWEDIRWVNGSGEPLPSSMYRNSWRSTLSTYGYDLVTLNHYAVRSAESFLVKRDRGRVNHVDRDQGLAYWFRMNNNAEEDRSIQRMIPAMRVELDRLMADPDIAAAHARCVVLHREKIAELKAREDYARFYAELTGPRLERLSRMHAHFGANVFLAGPQSIPDEIAEKDPQDMFTFTVAQQAAEH